MVRIFAKFVFFFFFKSINLFLFLGEIVFVCECKSYFRGMRARKDTVEKFFFVPASDMVVFFFYSENLPIAFFSPLLFFLLSEPIESSPSVSLNFAIFPKNQNLYCLTNFIFVAKLDLDF